MGFLQEVLIDPECDVIINAGDLAQMEADLAGMEMDLHFLNWFYCNSDFGPADGDVRFYLRQRYMVETGNPIPPGYMDEE